jgi:23S rRNA-/tRNA-specific pseudouridylate synthase
MEPKVIFEDEEILVIDKPAGMVVNRAKTVKEKTVQDWVEEMGGREN